MDESSRKQNQLKTVLPTVSDDNNDVDMGDTTSGNNDDNNNITKSGVLLEVVDKQLGRSL